MTRIKSGKRSYRLHRSAMPDNTAVIFLSIIAVLRLSGDFRCRIFIVTERRHVFLFADLLVAGLSLSLLLVRRQRGVPDRAITSDSAGGVVA